jgi:hypothetical protein
MSLNNESSYSQSISFSKPKIFSQTTINVNSGKLKRIASSTKSIVKEVIKGRISRSNSRDYHFGTKNSSRHSFDSINGHIKSPSNELPN